MTNTRNWWSSHYSITQEQAMLMILLGMALDTRAHNKAVHQESRQAKRAQARQRARQIERMADLDMHEQMRDLGSERDWYRLNTVGVHLRSNESYAEWEAHLIGLPWPACNFGSEPHTSTRSPGYDLELPYYPARNGQVIVQPVVPVDVPMTAYERGRQERKRKEAERKRAASLEARKRTLTDEQRRAILRAESVSLRGHSRV